MDGITDEELQQILSSGGSIADVQAQIEQMKQQAAMLKGMTPELNMRGNGRVQRASNPLEVVGNLAGNYMQMKNMDKQGAAAKDIAAQRTTQNNAVLAALLRQRKAQQSPTMPMATNPEDDNLWQ